MTPQMISITQYIFHATDSDLDVLIEAIKLRRKEIGQQRALELEVGDTVTLTGLSPQALNGLVGVLQSFDARRKRVTVLLDETSTRRLAFSGTRFALVIDPKAHSHPLTGIPVTCCEKQEVAA